MGTRWYREAQYRLVEQERRVSLAEEIIRELVLADYHHLRVGLGEEHAGDAIGSREHAVLLGHAGEDFESLFSFFFIAGIVAIGVQAQQSDRRCRIAGRRG